MHRRDFIVGFGATISLQGIDAAALPNNGDNTSPSKLEKLKETFLEFKGAAQPYLDVVVPLYSVYSGIQTQEFQRNVTDSLEKISSSLSAINSKLDTVITLLRDLPNMVRKELEANNRNNLLKSIAAWDDRILNYVEAYPNGKNMPLAEKDILRKQIYEPLLHNVSELRQWGPIAFIDVAYAFSTAYVAARWSQVPSPLFRASRNQVSSYIRDVGALFANMSLNEMQIFEKNYRTVNAHHGEVQLTLPSQGFAIATIRGSYDTGFDFANTQPIGSELGGRPNDFVAIQSPFVNLTNPDSPGQKLHDLLDILRSLVSEGNAAKTRAPIYKNYSDGAILLAEAINQIDY